MTTSFHPSSTVAQIVAEHPAVARVFQRHRIDFCCHGDVTVEEACRDLRIDPEAVRAELATAVAPGGEPAEDVRALPTPALVARIVDRHHGYLRRALPEIQPLAAKVAAVHGEHNPKLRPLQEAFAALAEALEPHLDDEEEVLFPALTARAPDAVEIRRGLDRMVEEHVAVGEQLARIRALADGFTTPEWGCRSYRLLMTELEALEDDVLRHVHLENHVLRPRFAGMRAAS